jgi:glycosyltransferase involved in cell wall biosynthesis
VRFSLVVATLGRTSELQRLLASLERQTHRDFDVIVVDQNPDERLLPILGAFEKRLDIRRLTCPPGLSRARNAGIREGTGDTVCFPDDDCWYPDDVLEKLKTLLDNHPDWHAIIGDAVDESGNAILPWRDRPGRVTKPICWRHAVTFACFVRAAALKKVGGFDESLGPGSGAPWGSGEDNDLMLRILKGGFRVQYENNIRINHPRMFLSFDKASRLKRYQYALGDGRLLRKHPMPLWWNALFFAVPTGRALIALMRFRLDETSFHWATFIGRISGFGLNKPGVAGGRHLV